MKKGEYLYQIKPVKSNFMKEQTAEEKDILESHFVYLQNLLLEGKLVLAGPCLDASFGIVILQNVTEDEARQIMEQDPAVKNQVMTGELFPFRVSLHQK